MTFENYIKGRIVTYAADQAYHHGGAEGMLAIAQVLANRVNAGWGEWDAVLKNANNYIGTTVPAPEIDPRNLSFRRLLSSVEDIYNGTADDSNVNIEDDRGKLPALYYAELNSIDRRWFFDNITSQLERHPRIATCGPLTFFA